MRKIVLYNPSLSSLNKGDDIIYDSAFRVINELFPDSFFVNISTHLPVSNIYLNLIKDAKLRFVLGTNLLMPNLFSRFRQWDINLLNSKKIGPVVLLGAGWWQYQEKINLYTKLVYKNVLSHDVVHSVRDSYTEQRLKSIGFRNVVNTGCPTMWELTPEHCLKIPVKKGKVVISTITDYKPDPKSDVKMFQILLQNYETVYLWLQGYNDYQYFNSLEIKAPIKLISPELSEYDKILSSKLEVDYIGTRLHAGIRALQKGRRSIIIGVDNRAKEKQKDFNLNVLDRRDLKELDNLINTSFKTDITIPLDAIKYWKDNIRKYLLDERG